MEVRIEAVDLEGILDVVSGRAVAVVVGILAAAGSSCVNCRQRIAAQNIGSWSCTAVRRSALLLLERRIEGNV